MSRSLSKQKRFRIFKRDNFTCMYCGQKPPNVTLEADHIKPVCEGGSDDPGNLITSCFDCNRGKSGESLNVVPDSLVETQARRIEALEQAEELHRMEKRAAKRMRDAVGDLEAEFSISFSPSAKRSIIMFVEKLGAEQVAEALSIASDKKRITDAAGWKYFCGICWTKIRAKGLDR